MIVENLNVATRHTKPRPMRDANRMGGTQMTPGGSIERPTAVPVVERDVVCPTCKLPTRVGYTFKEIKGGDASRCASASATAAARSSTDGRLPRRTCRASSSATTTSSAGSCKEQFELSSIMQVPRITKITLNMGVGEAKTDAKVLDAAMEELTIIAGQRAQLRRARKSVAQFKIREGMPIGARVTLRGDRMWEFLDRLISIALPRIRDFRGPQPELVRRPRQLLARASASRSSSPRSTTTRSRRFAASTSRSRPPPRRTSRPRRFCAASGMPLATEERND